MEIKELSKKANDIRKLYSKMEMITIGKQRTSAQIMEGFVVDIGDLMKLVMAKEGLREIENVDEKLAHELADCLYSVFVLAKIYGIDIEKEFVKTMDELEKGLEDYKK